MNVQPGFRTRYESDRFAHLLREHLDKDDLTKGADTSKLAKIVKDRNEINLSENSLKDNVLAYLRGNLVGVKRYLTPKGELKIEDCVLRLYHFLYAFRVPRDSEIIQVVREETGVNSVDYPPTQEYPYTKTRLFQQRKTSA